MPGRIAAAVLLMLTGAGCQSPSHETGEIYGVSEEFEGHVGQHMPLVFAKEQGEPWIVLTLCRKTTDASRPEMASYNVHVAILSSAQQYDLESNRLEFIADGQRISLARAGAIDTGEDVQAANYPIGAPDLKTLADAGSVTVRINLAEGQMTRGLDLTHLAAVDEFYVVCVEGGSPRHAGVSD